MPYHVDLPQFSGNEKEQLAQMRNYLYRQAEQLGYALNNIDSAVSGAYEVPKSLQNTSEIMKKFGDYVTENGTSNGWNYKKWNYGTYEMYGSFEVTPTASEKGASLYITNDIVIPTPFEIAEDAVVTGAAEGNCFITDGRYAATRAVSVRIMSDSAISTTKSAVIRLHVIGTYSTDTDISRMRGVGTYAINTEV